MASGLASLISPRLSALLLVRKRSCEEAALLSALLILWEEKQTQRVETTHLDHSQMTRTTPLEQWPPPQYEAPWMDAAGLLS